MIYFNFDIYELIGGLEPPLPSEEGINNGISMLIGLGDGWFWTGTMLVPIWDPSYAWIVVII